MRKMKEQLILSVMLTLLLAGTPASAIYISANLIPLNSPKSFHTESGTPTMIAVDPPRSVANLNTTVTVNVNVTNVADLSAWQIKLYFDPLKVYTDANSSWYPSGNVFSGGMILTTTAVIDTDANGTYILFGACIGPSSATFNGSGTLCSINFTVTTTDYSDLLFSRPLGENGQTFLLNSTKVGDDWIPFEVTDGKVGQSISVQTPAGSGITVSPANNVGVTFDNVTSNGITTMTASNPPTAQFVSAVTDGIASNATYTGNITLAFPYNSAGLSLQDQLAMKIWLWNASSSNYVDITTSVNTTSHIIYGTSPHLSMFTVTGNLGITDDLSVPGQTWVTLPDNPPALPSELAALNYYQINTTKNVPKPIGVSLAYSFINAPPGEEPLTRVLCWDDSSGSWIDVTTNVNMTLHTVYGAPPHLSMFAVTYFVPPPNGMSVTSPSYLKTVACQGYCANVSFTVCNQGYSIQTSFNASLYWNTTLLKTYQTNQLGPGEQEIFNFTWNTTGLSRGTYCVSACSHLIGWITVSKIGDLTGAPDGGPDGICDMKDIRMVAKSFGANLVTNPNSPKYGQYWHGTPCSSCPHNPNCDINNDGTIDMKDIRIAAKNFGK
jgi:hypothetical protein